MAARTRTIRAGDNESDFAVRAMQIQQLFQQHRPRFSIALAQFGKANAKTQERSIAFGMLPKAD